MRILRLSSQSFVSRSTPWALLSRMRSCMRATSSWGYQILVRGTMPMLKMHAQSWVI